MKQKHSVQGIVAEVCCDKSRVDCCQIYPPVYSYLMEDDATKRLEHVNTLFSRLTELERHLSTTNKPFFGGLKFIW